MVKKIVLEIGIILMLGVVAGCGNNMEIPEIGDNTVDAVDTIEATGDTAIGVDDMNTGDATTEEISSEDSTIEEYDETVDAANRTKLAEALSIEEDARCLKFLLSALRTVNAGAIESAELSTEGSDRIINVVAEDGTNYQIFVSNGNSLEAVKNADTGEWVITSEQ